ncbi:MAG: YkgJ family cysteine cluster protein [Deltaproteobacteria bacterium]|nr:YkgJ family cysteine cluster protein [Deltaproteobacteria bacterium]
MTAALLRLYAEVDRETGAFLARFPPAACDAGCADCCRSHPPLVAREEAMLVREAVAALPEPVLTAVRARARELALGLARGAEADFACPLLVEQDRVPRCAVYAARPYACRSFGHTARVPDGRASPEPFTCQRLLPRVARARPPPVPFRSRALRELAGVAVVEDSYMPVWVGLEPSEWERVDSGPAARVVVGRPA